MTSAKSTATISLVLFLIAFTSTWLFTRIFPQEISTATASDYFATYKPVALNLLSSRGYSRDGFSLLTYFPPGYSLTLAGQFWMAAKFGVEQEAIILFFNSVGVGLISICIFLISRSVWGNGLAITAALLWMIYPIQLWLSRQPNTEVPFMVFFFTSLLLFWRTLLHSKQQGVEQSPRHFQIVSMLLSGLLLGWSMLIRPAAIGVGVIWLIFWFHSLRHRLHPGWKNRWLPAGFFIAGLLLVILPWEIYVYLKSQQVIPLSTAGLTSLRDGMTFAIFSKDYRMPVNIPHDVMNLMELFWERVQVQPLTTVLASLWFEMPITFMKLILLKALRSWYATDSLRFEQYTLLIQIIYLSLTGAGTWLSWKKKTIYWTLTIFLFVNIAYFWLITISVLSILRYMLPAMGLIMILAPLPLTRIPWLRRWLVIPEQPGDLKFT